MQDFNQFNTTISNFAGGFQSLPAAEPARILLRTFEQDIAPSLKSVDPGVVSKAAVPWVSPIEPLYKHIARHLRTEIERGRYKAGDKLPSVRTMVVDFNVSHPTVLRALEELASSGYVKLVQGSGTYVTRRQTIAQSAITSIEGTENISPLSGLHGEPEGPASKKQLQIPTISKPAKETNGDMVLPFGQWQRCVRTALSEISSRDQEGTTNGLPALRHAISSYVRRSRGIVVDPGQVVITSGLSTALALVSELCLSPEDIVAMEDPGSPKMRRLLASHSANIKPLALDLQGISVNALKELNCKVKLLHVTPNQNPTGLVMTEQRRQSLLNWAAHAGTVVLEDNFGGEFTLSTKGETSLFALEKNAEVIYLGGFWSSLHPLMQTAYLLLSPTLAELAVNSAALKDSEKNLLEQHTLQHILNDGHLELHLKRSKKVCMHKRALTISALKQTLGARVDIVGSSVNGKQLIKFHDDVETRSIVTAALRSGLPLSYIGAHFIETKPSNQFLLSFRSLEETQIFNTALRFASLIK